MPSPPPRSPRRPRQRTLLSLAVFLLVAATLATGFFFLSARNKPRPETVADSSDDPTPGALPEISLPSSDSTKTPPPAMPPLLSRYLELITQGKAIRAKGNAEAAIPPLLEATRINPSGPEGLHELAVTYEKAGQQEKANTLWSSLLALGPAAEPFLAAAQSRFPKTAAPTPGSDLLLCIDSPILTRDPENQTNGTLHIPIRRKSSARVEVGSVRVDIRLYDLLTGNRIELTEADIHSRWASFPPEWVDRSTEILEAEFRVPPPPPKAAAQPARKFFGYVIRLYYKDALQETRADPPDLPAKLSAPQPLRPPE